MASERELLIGLYNKYCELDRKERYNRQQEQDAEKRAKQSTEGKKYFLAEQRCKERSEKNIKLQNMIITTLIILASIIVLGIALYFSAVTVLKNIDTILLPISSSPGEDVWTNRQYCILYTLGILIFISALCGIIFCALEKK